MALGGHRLSMKICEITYCGRPLSVIDFFISYIINTNNNIIIINVNIAQVSVFFLYFQSLRVTAEY